MKSFWRWARVVAVTRTKRAVDLDLKETAVSFGLGKSVAEWSAMVTTSCLKSGSLEASTLKRGGKPKPSPMPAKSSWQGCRMVVVKAVGRARSIWTHLGEAWESEMAAWKPAWAAREAAGWRASAMSLSRAARESAPRGRAGAMRLASRDLREDSSEVRVRRVAAVAGSVS